MRILLIMALLCGSASAQMVDYTTQQSLDTMKQHMSWQDAQRLQGIFDDQTINAARRAEGARQDGEMEEWATDSDH